MKKINVLKTIAVFAIVIVMFGGCGVGDLVAAPFRVTGAVVNIVAPDAVGNSISGVGDALDYAIPF